MYETQNFPYKLKENCYKIILPMNKTYVKVAGRTIHCNGPMIIIEKANYDRPSPNYYRISIGDSTIHYIYD